MLALAKEFRLAFKKLNSWNQWHIAIGFGKKHITAYKKNDLTCRKFMAFQSGHYIREHDRIYGQDADFPRHLQPDLLDKYYVTSESQFEFWLPRLARNSNA
jgi:hypothetical protein